jgi:hypothetical protein
MLADAILMDNWNVESDGALLQMTPQPPYYSLTIKEVKSTAEHCICISKRPLKFRRVFGEWKKSAIDHEHQ